MPLEEAVPPLSEQELADLMHHLRYLRAGGRVAVRSYLEACTLGIGGDLQLDAPCEFAKPRRTIAEASYRGELRRV